MRPEAQIELLRSEAKQAWGQAEVNLQRAVAAEAATRSAQERIAKLERERTRELAECPYCRKHGEKSFSPCVLHLGCSQVSVNKLEDGRFEFRCPVCGVESDALRDTERDLAEARRDAERYRVARQHIAPRYLWESMRLKICVGEWIDLPPEQLLAEKVDELCDAAMGGKHE